MSIRPRIRELAPYDFAPHPEGVKLDQNELPYDLTESLREEFVTRVATLALNRYPDLEARELRIALAGLHDWPQDGVVVTPGSNVLIQYLVIAAGIGQSVLIPSPTFGVYRQQALMLDTDLIEVPMGPRFELPTDRMLTAMERSQGIIFVANPAAPTGNLHPQGELERLIDAADHRWTIVIDEAYAQFAGSDLSNLARRPSVISIRTLSKAFGLAGARIGYALTSPEIAREIRKIVLPFAVSGLQQAAALTMVANHDFVVRRAQEVAAERQWLMQELHETPGVTAFPSVTNFVLFKVSSATRVYEGLLRRGVVVRLQSAATLQNCLRVSVGTRDENEGFLAALRESLTEDGDE
ncbi:MAG: histidinol-phosphate transaminase [Trueperaceae bacterium]